MGRSRYAVTEKRIQQWVKEGRGQGAGPNYKAWLRVSDVPSIGMSHRVFCEITKRMYHLLSYLEYAAFLMARADSSVVEIREGYPLERSRTREIAKRIRVAHPRYPGTKVDTVMTSDLLLTRRHPDGERYEGWSVKPLEKLDDGRVCEKLFIEGTYYDDAGRPFNIVSEDQIPQLFLRNFERMRAAWNLEKHPNWNPHQARQFQATMLSFIPNQGDLPYEAFCRAFDRTYEFERGDAHYLFTNLMAHGIVTVDMNIPWSVEFPLTMFTLYPAAFERLVSEPPDEVL